MVVGPRPTERAREDQRVLVLPTSREHGGFTAVHDEHVDEPEEFVREISGRCGVEQDARVRVVSCASRCLDGIESSLELQHQPARRLHEVV